MQEFLILRQRTWSTENMILLRMTTDEFTQIKIVYAMKDFGTPLVIRRLWRLVQLQKAQLWLTFAVTCDIRAIELSFSYFIHNCLLSWAFIRHKDHHNLNPRVKLHWLFHLRVICDVKTLIVNSWAQLRSLSLEALNYNKLSVRPWFHVKMKLF